MKKTSVLCLVALGALWGGGEAFAQQPYGQPAPAPAPAPDSNDAQHTVANDVTTLNGQNVKVGEKHQYRLGYKQWNVSANPFGFFFDSYAVALAKSLSPNIALRGELHFVADAEAVGLAVGLPIYFSKVFYGLFFEPGIGGYTAGGDTSWLGPQLLIGYHWYWDSNLNLGVAAGIGRNFSSDNDYDEVFPAGYFQVGYAFDL